MKPAPLAALEEVEWRVDGEPSTRDGKSTCRFVPYLDARYLASLLDEWVGNENWSDVYEPTTFAGKEAMWCRLSLRVGDEWIGKTDIGVPSQWEGQKGAVSDAFKRAACLKWGAGRNVYDLPTLYAHCRTFTSKGRVQAAADGQRTLDDITRQLKARGFDASGGRVADTPDPEPEVAPFVSADNAAALREKCEALGVDVAEAVRLATNGRTELAEEVRTSEIRAVKESVDRLTPAENSRPDGGSAVPDEKGEVASTSDLNPHGTGDGATSPVPPGAAA